MNVMCFRPPTATQGEGKEGAGAPPVPGAPRAPQAPGVPGAPKVPGVPGAPRVPQVPGASAADAPEVLGGPEAFQVTGDVAAAQQQEASEGAAEFMGDAPGAAVQSCVPTIKAKTAQKKAVFVPPAPK